jgi:hypothetical protein
MNNQYLTVVTPGGWTCGMSNVNRLRAPTARRLKPLSIMTNPHRPARMITKPRWKRGYQIETYL